MKRGNQGWLFFLNDNIQRNKSGIEHAQIKRLHLFENIINQLRLLLGNIRMNYTW